MAYGSDEENSQHGLNGRFGRSGEYRRSAGRSSIGSDSSPARLVTTA